MSRRPLRLLLGLLACLMAALMLASCRAVQPTAAAVVATPTATLAPTITVTATTVPTVTAAPTAAATASATPVRPEIYSFDGLSMQAEWAGSASEPAFDWSPDGSLLAFSAAQGVTVLHAETYQAQWSGPAGMSLSFSADGQHVAIATGQQIEIHAALDGRLETRLAQPPCAQAQWVGYRADNQSLVAAWVDAKKREAVFARVDAAEGTCAEPFARMQGGPDIVIQSFAVSHERSYVTAVIENQVYLWSTADGKEVARKPGQIVVFDAHNNLFAVKDGATVTVYVLDTLNEVEQTFQLPGSRALGLGSGRSLLAAASTDGLNQQVYFYETHFSSRAAYILRDLPGDTRALSFSPDSQHLLVVAYTPRSGQPSRYMALGLYSGLPAKPQDGAFQVSRPAVTPAPLFPILYPPPNGQDHFPEPIARPDGQLTDYRLKAWNEQHGLDMIQPLIDFATADFVYGPASSTWYFIWPQDAIRLAALEFLQRFPRSPNTEVVQWRQALSNDVLDRYDWVAWVLAQIEQGLNSGRIDPADSRINTNLAPFGFIVQTSLYPALDPELSEGFWCHSANNPVLAPGLFGDGATAKIVLIRGIWSPIGIIAALHQSPQGTYQLTPIHSSLNFDAGLCQAVLVQDLTADGTPEVWVEETWHSGSMDERTSYIYQWRDGRFVDISGGYISSWDFPYEVKLSGSDSQAKTIEFTHYDPLSGQVTSRLKWNGTQFIRQHETALLTMDAKGQINTEPLTGAMQSGQYVEISRQIRAYLGDPKNTQLLPAEDLAYLHFELAMSEAFQFDPSQARIELENWFRPELTGDNFDKPYPRAAQAFLKAYQHAPDLYQACQAVWKTDASIAMFGCDPNLALRELAKRSASLESSRLPDLLDKYGVKLARSITFNANDDNQPDWLLIPAPQPGGPKELQPWLLISTPGGYAAFDNLPSGLDPSAMAAFKELQLPGARDKALLLYVGEKLRLFAIHSGAGLLRIDTLYYGYAVSAIQKLSAVDGYELLIWHEGSNYSPPELARWDAKSGKFTTYDYAEDLLLVKGRPRDAARLIPAILDRLKALPDKNYLKTTEPPRLRYLLGLAYELSGDSVNAARVYYDLWNTPPIGQGSHAEQPYAMMARDKLEKVK